MSVDNPPAFSEKCGHQPAEKGYFVTIAHGSFSTAKSKSFESRSIDEKSSDKCCHNLDRFRFLQPVALRSFHKFFSPCHEFPNCENTARNFNYNLWYFQLNYAMLLTLVVLVAIKWVHFYQFTLEIYCTVVVLALLYVIENCGFQLTALGRKVHLSEQYTTVIVLMVLYNGFLPEAFEFIYFFSGYIVFVVIHASINQASMFYHADYPVYHI